MSVRARPHAIVAGEHPISEIPIARLAAPLAARLESAPFVAGRVHSVFTRCVNLEWRDGRLVSFHAPGPLAAPFAASLAAVPDLTWVRAGDLVRRRGAALRLGPLEVTLDGAISVDLSMPPAHGPSEVLGAALAALGALPCAEALRSPRGGAALARLAAAIQDGDPRAFTAAALALVGLGEGLTPAGDDCLVGALAALRRFVPADVVDAPARRAIGHAARSSTTAVAREFILHALEGSFAEPLVSLLTVREPDAARRAAAELARTGATSGADTLAGIRVALQAIEARHT